MGELFKYDPNETLKRNPQRPLGAFSNFVVESLPYIANTVRNGNIQSDTLSRRTQELVDGLSPDVLSFATSTPERADVALLDMLFMDNTISRLAAPNPRLISLIENLSIERGRPPIITYEDLILTNPLREDPRTHTTGEIGASEQDFYQAHNDVEAELEQVIKASKDSIDALSERGQDAVVDVIPVLSENTDRWKKVVQRMLTLWEDMDANLFTQFRFFLVAHPSRVMQSGEAYKGPSGAFTASVPVAELYYGGEAVSEEFMDYLAENDMYFPRQGRVDIIEAKQSVAEGKTLVGLCNSLGRPPELSALMNRYDILLNQFRTLHERGAKKHVVDVVGEGAVGTGGESNIVEFLKKRNIKHFS